MISQQFRKYIHSITALSEPEVIAVPRDQKVVIGLHPSFAYKQPAAPYKLFVAVNPNVEILARLIPRKRNVHTFDHAPRFEVANRRDRRKTFGSGASLERPSRVKKNDSRLRHLHSTAATQRQPRSDCGNRKRQYRNRGRYWVGHTLLRDFQLDRRLVPQSTEPERRSFVLMSIIYNHQFPSHWEP